MFKLIFGEKQIEKKFEFFYQNRGLTRFENGNFWPYEKFSKKVSFFR